MNDDKKLPRLQLPEGLHADTLAVREGLPATQWSEHSEALFMTSSFVHPDCATAAARFANEQEAFVYSRFSNPTVTMLERRLAALEGTSGCIATSSGMAAILITVLSLLQSGDHVVCSRDTPYSQENNNNLTYSNRLNDLWIRIHLFQKEYDNV